MNDAKLSKLQRSILVWIYEESLRYSRNTFLADAVSSLGDGVLWRDRNDGPAMSTTRRVNDNRALRRLEARGLVEVGNGRGRHDPTRLAHRVKLTADGWAIAERLADPKK